MPEMPDVVVYVEALERFVGGRTLECVRLLSPFVLRSWDPPIQTIESSTVRTVDRLGKRIVLGFDEDRFLIVHLMIAGRLRWRSRGAKASRKVGLAAFDFEHGTLLLTEASGKKRASLHLVAGQAALAEHDPGGLEVLDTTLETFHAVLARSNHTLKRALTDPHILSGIGNAYSDEILHRAGLSPFKRTADLGPSTTARLFDATREVLHDWIDKTRAEVGDTFPDKVTAFRPGMAVHGRFGKPCPQCDTPVQRLVYAEREANYCPTCQTGGTLLADRALSRLLKGDWPRTLDELEARKQR